MFVPSILLKQLYTRGSLSNKKDGIHFSLKNRLKDSTIKKIISVSINGKSVPLEQVSVRVGSEDEISVLSLNEAQNTPFALRAVIDIHINGHPNLTHAEKQVVGLSFDVAPFGTLKLDVEDVIAFDADEKPVGIPRDDHDDYGDDIIKQRQRYFCEASGASIEHLAKYSINPQDLKGNIENFIGVAQVPIGVAGPMIVNGEHARGEFLVPLATTEGTLVASYNRGMKLMNMSGGVKSTVVDDAMQRAPVFVFEDARGARDFVAWIKENFSFIKEEAEATSSVAKLTYIDHFLSNKFAFLRFNFKTGDAAGQNMVGRATFAACGWILDHYKDNKVTDFYLESNFATDKKASQINIMRTRGKRVTAEITLKREDLLQVMRVDPKQIDYHGRVASVGSFLSGVNNTGLHSPNGITAMFIATGQDVANVSESSAGILYSELTDEGDLYLSITIPSLIVATYGGGTGIGTQKECLELMDCYGRDRVLKFAEIVGAVVLAGEISLASAISSSDWVSSHEQYGRNR
ncbi:hydroxymethylglutaryl-CoA reductase [Alteromonas sp. a30]|uniref:hydroxymethylglutaryl-CoA reductase n=1 Tax=Alteromonas sp. a30 TaxID=2730917 RepID=UPI002DDDB3CA|nr:hydroxymethylglutaryl-CoA reductase [Alteromonas sp. a30]MCY7296839.1 hydroxymethylglutaryl-CoA reductase [Alteromonas sp. a30]